MTEPEAQSHVRIFKGIKEESKKKNHIANIYVVNIYEALL